MVNFERQGVLDDPGSVKTFERCKLDMAERDAHAAAYALHADLLRVRREHVAFCTPGLAGYHWITDWGRDTMISLEGLTLTTGRHVEAAYIWVKVDRHAAQLPPQPSAAEGRTVSV